MDKGAILHRKMEQMSPFSTNGTICFNVFVGVEVMACQDYFTHFEPSQLVGGVKTGDSQEKNT